MSVRHRSLLFSALILFGLGWSDPSRALVTVTIVDDDKADIEVEFPDNSSGFYNIEMEIEFENPVNLTVECLNVSADLLDAGEISALQARMPGVPGRFVVDTLIPVKIVVEPLPSCNLQFENQIEIEVHTEELVYTFPSPYRLMKAPLGQNFRDVTGDVLAGSIRARGSSGTFSEFVLVQDLVQDFTGDAVAGFNALDTRLRAGDLSLLASEVLTEDLRVARAAYDRGAYADAIARLQAMVPTTRSFGGSAIPNRYSSQGGLVDAVGEIKSLTDALIYRVRRVANL